MPDAGDEPRRPRQALEFRAVDAEPPAVFDLWAEHEPVLRLWWGVATQWRISDGQRTGLDYPGVRAAPAFRAVPRADRESLFDDLVAVEHAYVSELGRQAQIRASMRAAQQGLGGLPG